MPDDADRIEWWQTEVEKLAFQQSALGDAVSLIFCPDQIGYQPFGIPNTGKRATLNPKPFIGPADSVMVTVEDAKSGAMLGRYWFAPDRELMCVRSEMADNESGYSTMIVDAAEKSPKGHWYATQLRTGRVASSGDDLQAVSSLSPVAASVYRYLVKFDSEY